jgi:integrase
LRESKLFQKGGDTIKKPGTLTNGDVLCIRDRLTGQDRLIFDFSLETGLRISDVLRIRRNQIAKEMEIVEKKTGKRRSVKISETLFFRIKHLQGTKTKEYAFSSPRTNEKPLHRSTYHLHLKKVSQSLGVNFSAHSTRKLFARNLFEATGDIFVVQKALNHKYITTTFTYLDIDLGELVRKEVKYNGKETASGPF